MADDSVPRLSPSPAVRRTLGWSVVDGVLHSVMLGTSESFLGAFAVELGHDNGALALLMTIPPLCGALAQLLAPFLTVWLKSRRRMVVFGAGLQAASHLGFVAIAVTRSDSLALLLGAKIAFWISGMVIGPPWNAWMTSVTENIPRATYFMWRSVACNVALLVSFLLSGSFLQHSRASDIYAGFAALFFAGLVSRGLATFALSLQQDDEPPPSLSLTFMERLRGGVREGPWKLVLAIGALQFGSQVAIPFFTPYMLRTLRLELDVYAGLTAVSIVGKVASLPLWGGLARRLGLTASMTLSIVGIALVPACWVLADNMTHLILVQILGGVAWAGFEYASFQLLIGAAPRNVAVEFFSLSGTFGGAMQLAGSLMGSWLLRSGYDYHSVFWVSSVLRAVPLFLLTPIVSQLARGLRLRKIFVRMVSVRAAGGVERRPLSIPPSAGPKDD